MVTKDTIKECKYQTKDLIIIIDRILTLILVDSKLQLTHLCLSLVSFVGFFSAVPEIVSSHLSCIWLPKIEELHQIQCGKYPNSLIIICANAGDRGINWHSRADASRSRRNPSCIFDYKCVPAEAPVITLEFFSMSRHPRIRPSTTSDLNTAHPTTPPPIIVMLYISQSQWAQLIATNPQVLASDQSLLQGHFLMDSGMLLFKGRS